jgi:hypothetical protein
MIAIQAGNLAFVKHLLQQGANTSLRDYRGKNAKAIAQDVLENR